ncbi:YrhK family protein [Streptomyces sp. NPDC079189]|uniref:YrhK family protein n=1 Tax=Actinomycetes TaxID=1760 RepID=UPI00342B0BF8
MTSHFSSDGRTIRLLLGSDEVVIRRKYEVASILNDILVAGWFVVGSVLFFCDDTKTAGTWFFLLGSIQLLIRPIIRLTRHVHLRRFDRSRAHDTTADY